MRPVIKLIGLVDLVDFVGLIDLMDSQTDKTNRSNLPLAFLTGGLVARLEVEVGADRDRLAYRGRTPVHIAES